MGMRKNSFHCLAWVLILVALSGCAHTNSGPLAWLSPKPKSDVAVEQLLSSQKGMFNKGKQSSLYPAAVIQKEPVPSKEKDLKNASGLNLSYARLQEQLGHLTEARAYYEKVVTKEPRSVEANIGLARLNALAGHNTQAEQQFRKAIEIDRHSPEALFALGEFLAGQKRYTEAIVEMQKAVQKNPQNTQYQFEIGLALARSGQLDESYAALSDLVGEAEAYYNIGYIALKELNDPVTAKRYLGQSLELDPDLQQSRYWLAELKSKQDMILPASGRKTDEAFKVRHAMNVQSDSQPRAETLIPTVVSETVNSDDLTPEQWEQWKNQSELQ